MSKQKSPATSTLGLLFAVGILGLVGLIAYLRLTPAAQIPDELKRADKRKVTAYTPVPDGSDVKLQPREVDVPERASPIVTAVNAFLTESNIVPTDARAIGAEIRNGTLHLGFSPAFARTHGSDDEKTLIDGLIATVKQFPEVQRLSLEVDGKPIETLGNVDLTDGLEVRPLSADRSPGAP